MNGLPLPPPPLFPPREQAKRGRATTTAVVNGAVARKRSTPEAAKPGNPNTRAQEQLAKVLQARSVLPARSVKPLTLPDDVELHTAKRHRACDEQVRTAGMVPLPETDNNVDIVGKAGF